MILFAALGIGSLFVASSFTFRDQFQVVKDVSLGAMSIFSWLLATLATAIVIPKDIEERTLYTILAKPVSRLEYLLGKLFGCSGCCWSGSL
jgi:ABC-type transport system involved in multi-copper enzyme maturation permease subunit